MNARRDALRRAGGLVAGAMLGLDMRPAAAQEPVKFSTGTDKPKLSAPPGSTDCHFHIYDNRFPPAPGGLPAADALPADYRALQARIGTLEKQLGERQAAVGRVAGPAPLPHVVVDNDREDADRLAANGRKEC